MTKKLEKLFDLPTNTDIPVDSTQDVMSVDETKTALREVNDMVDKIEEALPMVRDLDTGDSELDEIAAKAVKSFEELSDLGMQVDARYASELFAVAGTMLGHALTAKTNKLNKKLKMVELQLKKAKFDLDKTNTENILSPFEEGQGQVLNRNDLLDRLITTNRNSKDN